MQLELDLTPRRDDNLIRLMLQPPSPLVVDDTAHRKLDRYRRDQRRKYKA
ncbi:MAG: hypothetical protein HC833_10765 [Leptolyngbyaceae cyanobacterium RM1_406_9]|nr:hypothetical protein [Leptolyngbyaceae cyanobacterium RM1_406_9]